VWFWQLRRQKHGDLYFPYSAVKVIKSWRRPWTRHVANIDEMTRHTNSTENSRNIYTEIARYYDVRLLTVYYMALRAGFNSLEEAREMSNQAQSFGWVNTMTCSYNPPPRKSIGVSMILQIEPRYPFHIHPAGSLSRVDKVHESASLILSFCALVNWDYVCCAFNGHGLGEEQEETRRKRSENCLPVPNYRRM